ncbi:hypothetical protein pb186bvf_006203 [Paramecium bursaria]
MLKATRINALKYLKQPIQIDNIQFPYKVQGTIRWII